MSLSMSALSTISDPKYLNLFTLYGLFLALFKYEFSEYLLVYFYVYFKIIFS